jgi:hypothetical protein
MKTLFQRCKAATQARHKAREARNDYVTIRRAYREGKATVGELARALALSDFADAEQSLAEAEELL